MLTCKRNNVRDAHMPYRRHGRRLSRDGLALDDAMQRDSTSFLAHGNAAHGRAVCALGNTREMEPVASTNAQLASLINAEYDTWGRLAKQAGIYRS